MSVSLDDANPAHVARDQSFNRLFSASPTPFLVLAPDAPRYTITEVNDAYLAASMRTREDLVGRALFDAFPDNPDDTAATGVNNLRASLDRALATRRPDAMARQKYDIARPDGTFEERWWDPVNSPVLDDRGEVEALVHHVTDVTEQRRGEVALRDSEAALRQLNADLERKVTERALARGRTWQVSPEIMGVLNAGGVCFEESNPAWEKVLGWSKEEVARTSLFDFIHPDDLARTQAAWTDATERRLPALGFENRYRHKDGGWRWLSWVAVPDDGKVYCSARDITADKEREAELAARTAERDRLWRNSQDVLVVIDSAGVFRTVNPAFTRILGWAEADVRGRSAFDFIHPDDQASTLGALEHATERELPTFENRYLHKDGGWRWLSWVAAPEGELIFATARHVTAEKDAAAELARTQEALRQSQKLEAMGSLTGGVSHDFNNLLTPIIGSLDMLVRKGIGSERERRLIDGALQSAERAKTLVQRLLAFARRQPLQPTAVDIGRLVDGMADLIGSTLGPTIHVCVDLAPDLPPANADPNQLEMALLNLAVNARDAMPEGGELTIAAKRESLRNADKGGIQPGHYVRLCIADTGLGMDQATLDRAVEPFFSTKGIGKGTGLGLSMVHGLAAQLGGGLKIDSVPGRGTTIELWLPISASLASEDEQPIAASPAPTGRGRALLVDDEELVRMSTADMLVDLGFEVVEAGSAEEALRLIKNGAAPDLLITDHLMPGMSGADLAREARVLKPALPVLLVSGYAEVEGIAPEWPRLTKPFRNAELAASLTNLIPAIGA